MINKLEQINEIYKILDSKYFHICIDSTEEKINWTIFYNNLSTEDYCSIKNQPLLTSKKNTIEDIYALKKRFEIEKQKIFSDNLFDYIKSNFSRFKVNIRNIFGSIFIEISTLICIICFINLLINTSLWTSIICIILSINILIVGNFGLRKLDKLLDEDFKEQYIKTLTRNFNFVERLKLWN